MLSPRRVLDLDHVGAEVAEDLAAQRAGEDRRDVEDTQSLQRRRGRGGIRLGLVVSLGGTLHLVTVDVPSSACEPPAAARIDALGLAVSRELAIASPPGSNLGSGDDTGQMCSAKRNRGCDRGAGWTAVSLRDELLPPVLAARGRLLLLDLLAVTLSGARTPELQAFARTAPGPTGGTRTIGSAVSTTPDAAGSSMPWRRAASSWTRATSTRRGTRQRTWCSQRSPRRAWRAGLWTVTPSWARSLRATRSLPGSAALRNEIHGGTRTAIGGPPVQPPRRLSFSAHERARWLRPSTP